MLEVCFSVPKWRPPLKKIFEGRGLRKVARNSGGADPRLGGARGVIFRGITLRRIAEALGGRGCLQQGSCGGFCPFFRGGRRPSFEDRDEKHNKEWELQWRTSPSEGVGLSPGCEEKGRTSREAPLGWIGLHVIETRFSRDGALGSDPP